MAEPKGLEPSASGVTGHKRKTGRPLIYIISVI